MKGRRLALPLALALSALACLYAYLGIPLGPDLLGELEGVLLLNTGVGAAIGAAYVTLRTTASFEIRSGWAASRTVKLARAVAVLLFPTAVALYAATRNAELAAALPCMLSIAVFCARGLKLWPPEVRGFLRRNASEDKVVGFVTGRAHLRRLAERRAARIATLLSKAGEVGNPYALSARSLAASVIAAPVAAAAALVLSFLVSPAFAVLGLFPLVAYFAVEVRLRDRVSQRREGVEKELPFFSILVNVLGSAGEPLYAILVGITGSDVFRAIQKEALLVKRDVVVFGEDPNASLEALASNHPSRKFSAFLYGYTSKVRSGGDIPAYLTGESGSLLRELEEGWTRYASRAGMIGSSMITVFGVIPLLLMVVGIFSPNISVLGLTVFTGVCVPLFTVLLVYAAGRMQPVGEQALEGDFARSLLLSLPGLGVAALTRQFWVAAASALFVFLVVYGISVREQRVEMREIDEALPEFMKDVLEYKRQEYDLTRSLVSIAAHNRYNASFDRVLARAAVQLKAGTPVDELAVDPKTRLAKMAFFVLGEMGRSGGGTVETVYQLSAYTGKVVEMKRATQAEMRPYMLLAYASPVLLAFGVSFVEAVLQSFSGTVRPGLSNFRPSGLLVGTVPPAMIEVSNLLIVVSAAALGVIGAKMTDFTVRNTLKASANVVVAVTATYALSAAGLASV
ncbi:MAG TPA: type II secretion system F family protein, partial [Nitrososphaerales archaeon]|nr:type II secretion system F family protein [Nitrososphaerales archaeon]